MDVGLSPLIHHGGCYVRPSGRVRVKVPNVSGNELLLTQTAFEVSPYPDIVTLCYETAHNMLRRDKETQAHTLLFLRDRKSRCGGTELALAFVTKEDDAFSNLVRNVQ